MKNCKRLYVFLLSSLFSVVVACMPHYAIADQAKESFKCISKKDWKCANSFAKRSKDSALQKIVLSQQFVDDTHKGNSFEKVVKFIQQNPGWPFEATLKAKAESYINSFTSSKAIYNWFSKNKPVTGEGYKHYAYAASKQKIDNAELTKIIKNGWRYGNFDDAELKKYKQKFGKHLNEKDHVLRIDNNLMQGKITAAKATMSMVSRKYRDSFEAQIALIRKNNNAGKLFKKISAEHYTPGLVYHYLKYRKRDLPNGDEVVGLIKKIRHHTDYGDKLFSIQNYLAREYIEHKKYRTAYKVISCHFATSASSKSDAEFLAGWIALRYLHKPTLASKHFEKFDKVVSTPVSKARGKYWLGRAYLALGNEDTANEYFQEASVKYPYTFYGQAAALELPRGSYKLPGNIDLTKFSNDQLIANNDLYKATLLACKYGSTAMAQVYLKAAAKKAKTPKKIYAIAHEIDKIGNIHYKVWFGKMAIAHHVFIKNMNYLLPYKVDHLPPENSLTYSIIRQESVYDQHAVSSANAYGLMQVIKPTACTVAKGMQMQCSVSKLTRDPKYNMAIGAKYLNDLVGEYEGSYILAAAEYNAGPVVKKWLKTFGDPREIKDHHKVIDWMEHIPYGETRAYVQRVLENLQVFRSIIHKKSKLRLSDELLHKRKS